MQPHQIHLKGPWEYQWIARDDGRDVEPDGTAEPQRVIMPVSWRDQFGPAAGRVRWVRSFGKPTNLETHERVFICLDGVGGTGTVWLNGRELGRLDGSRSAARFEATDFLQPRNSLAVELRFDPQRHPDEPGGLWGLVAIEIEGSQ